MWLYAWLVPCVIAYIILSRVRRWVRINNVENKYILVTGCDTGFGNLLAQTLDMRGCHVFATCLTDSGKTRLQQVGSPKMRAFVMDVTKEQHIQQAVDIVTACLPEGEGLWGLVNNAASGGNVVGPPEWYSAENFQQLLEVNTLGPIRVTMAFLPLLKKARGRLVNMSSSFARLSLPFILPYCMTKAAVESFSDGLRPHLAQYGVTVHVIEPGAFTTNLLDTKMLKRKVQQGWKQAPRLVKEEFGQECVDNLTNVLENAMRKGSSANLNKVIKAYVHALTARCPRTRYSVGWDARLFYIPLSYVPSSVADFFVGRIINKFPPAVLSRNKDDFEGNVEKVD